LSGAREVGATVLGVSTGTGTLVEGETVTKVGTGVVGEVVLPVVGKVVGALVGPIVAGLGIVGTLVVGDGISEHPALPKQETSNAQLQY